MNFSEYQIKARQTAIYPDVGSNLWYPTLGLAGESGEVAEKVKKIYRDWGGIVFEEQRNELCKELGDALWYIANVSAEAGLDLEEVARTNLRKLQDRANRDKLHGEGDNR